MKNAVELLMLHAVLCVTVVEGFFVSWCCRAGKQRAVAGRNGRIVVVFDGRSTTTLWSVSNKGSSNVLSDATTSTETKNQRHPVQVPSSLARYIAVQALLPPRTGATSPLSVERLENSKGYNDLSARDRSFCRLLFTTCERRLGQIDAVLRHCCHKPESSGIFSSTVFAKKRTGGGGSLAIDQLVQAVLRLGAAQILFLDVPAHAAVKETVDVLRMPCGINKSHSLSVPEGKIKFVNAILRRLSLEGERLLTEHGARLQDNAAPWLVEEWERTWGEEVTQHILQTAMEYSPSRCLTVRQSLSDMPGPELVRSRQSQISKVAALFDHAEILPQGSIRLIEAPVGPVASWSLYEEGAWWIQDVSATIPAIALYQELSRYGTVSVSEISVVDLCAAPGGKTAQLSNYGFAKVTAVDVSPRRCKRLNENKERLQLDWEVVVADGVEWIPEQRVAGVLVDAPCTATGTASKRPDVLRRHPDYQNLLETQYRLACHAADEILAPGGTMIYATCSLLKQESEDQVARLLQRERGAKLIAVPFVPGEIPGFDHAIDKHGNMRVFPGTFLLGPCDGFFVAKLKRAD
jgi:16S rRNA (cytosine967-C5)-methyltransferase